MTSPIPPLQKQNKKKKNSALIREHTPVPFRLTRKVGSDPQPSFLQKTTAPQRHEEILVVTDSWQML